MTGSYDHMMGSGTPWMVLVVLLAATFTLAIVGGWAVARHTLRPGHPVDPPVELLRSRLATGEIDDEEYLRRRSALGSD